MNKVLYAREGAKCIMDRTFADFPWQVRVEVDGVELEVPEVSMIFLAIVLNKTIGFVMVNSCTYKLCPYSLHGIPGCRGCTCC